MALCQIKRTKDDEIEDVLASNGKPSLAYKSLLDAVTKTSGEDLTPLRERFKFWEGKHIRDVNNPKELALAMYKQLYSPAFKQFFGNWDKKQGSDIVDENGEPKVVDNKFIGLQGRTKSIFNRGTFDRQGQNIYQQVEGTSQTIPSKASPATLKKISEFTARIGVDIHILQNLTVNGQRIGVNGLADPLRGLIQVASGKVDVALPEEAMHIAVELIEQKNPALFKQMMSSIGNYKMFTSVVSDYKDIKGYQLADGKPNIPKLKKETIAKVLAQTIIDKNENNDEKSPLLAQTKTWWQKIIDFLKRLFNKAKMNPFEETAESILKGEEKLGNVGDLKEDSGIFLQKNDELANKLKENNKDVAKTKDGYEVNGEKVRNSVSDKVNEYIRRRFRERTMSEIKQKEKDFKQETEGKSKEDIKDILSRYIDDDGDVRTQTLPQTNPSAVDPYDNTYYNTLDSHILDRLNSYPGGTKFFKSINVFDSKTSTAGTIDLMAILPDSKVDILQFKAPDVKPNNTDIPLYMQESYNIEIEGLRGILQNGYGVNRKDFRQTRAIPIRVDYQAPPAGSTSPLKVKSMKIGNINAQLIDDDVLLPIPSKSELTGSEKFDKLLSRLRGLVQRIADEKVTPDKRLEKTQRISSLLASIRKLQIQGKADGVLSSAKTTVKIQQEKYTKLKESIDKTDPQQSSIEDLNRIAAEILDDKDQIELYTDLYRIFKDIYTDGSPASEEYLRQARIASDDAQDSVDNYWDMSVKFRTEKMAAKVNINDEFRPEKNINMYRRMVRSLSQSPIKAGAVLWKLVENINHRFQLEFQDRYEEVKKLRDKVEEWMRGKDIKDLYSKIFQISPDGKWNGRFIQKFDKVFYSDLRKAQEKNDLKWVKDNLDVAAYDKWYKEEHQKRIEDSKTARLHEDDVENKRRILQQLTEFVNIFSLAKKNGVNTNNYKLKDFPLEAKWKSNEYKNLEKPENGPLLDLYNHWRGRLKESLESGMIEEHNGWSWFPNVRRNLLEKLTTGKGSSKFLSFLNNLRVEAEDTSLGKIDPLTHTSIDEVHANYVHDLGQWVKSADGSYFQDFSEKSMDLFKVMALWDREIIKYRLKTESEALARMLAYTEQGKESVKTGRTGKVLRNKETGELITGSNDINAKYIKDHIDAVWYGKSLSDQMDVSINIPYKGAVERINKLFGKEILTVPEEENIHLSGVKAIDTMNRFFVTKTLGVNVFTALSNLFGGTINSFMNQGIYMTKKDLAESELEYVSGKFWKSDESRKIAGLLHYLNPYLEDKTMEESRNLSVSAAVRRLSSDHLFVLQRASDNWVNDIIAISFIKNTMVKDGKFVNIRDYARKELGYGAKWAGTYKEGVEFDKKLEEKVAEYKKSSDSLLNIAQILDDKISIPGIERISPTTIALRQQILTFIKDALGNTSREDLSLYKRSVIWQSFFMFKNWIPRMLDVRGQSLKYDPGSQKYEWGRVRMLGRAVHGLGLRSVGALIKQIGGNNESIVEIAKKIYREKQQYFAEQEQDFDMNEGEFVDMFIKGVRSEFKELGLALGLMGILVAARLLSPNKDDDPRIKGAYKWALRGIDKLQDEVSFFYNPSSFTDIINGSVVPSIGMLVDIQKFLRTGLAKIFYEMIGNEKQAKNEKMSKYIFKILPVTKELMTYIAIFNNDIAKEYGIKISSQNGSSR